VAGRSRARGKRSSEFTWGRLLLGLLLVTVVGAVAAFLIARSGGGPKPGTLVYATPVGVYTHDLETGRDERVVTLPEGTVAAIPSPDGKWVAYGKDAGEVWLAALDHDQRYQIADQLAIPLGWSPDGRLLVSELGDDHDLVAVVPDGAREVIADGVYGGGTAPVWISDDRVAIAKGEGQFVIIDVSESRPKETAPILGTPLAASPDGEELLVSRGDALTVSKIESDEPLGLRVIFEGAPNVAAASPQGYLAVSAKDKDGHNGVWIFQGGTDSTKVVEGTVNALTWTSEGAVLIYERKGVVYALEHPGAEPKRVSREGVKVFPLLSFTVVR
jgi:hypothetical protein